MADKLIVRDFGPIRNAELDIKKTTVLIGPQGSGKSTLAKLVAFATDNSRTYQISNSPIDFNKYNLQGFNSESSYFQVLGREIIVTYLGSSLGTDLRFNPDFKDKLKILDLKELVARSNPNDGKAISELLKNISNVVYIPAERTLFATISGIVFSLIANKIPIPDSILEFGNSFENAKRYISDFKTSILDDVIFSSTNGQDLIIHNNASLPLSQSASGYQSLIPMQLVVEHYSKNSVLEFIIEEPELNLYPTTQKKLIYYLAQKCTKKDNQFLLTTHSPYVLSSLNNLLFAYKVAKKHPEMEEEISKIIPKESWLNPEDFAAYFVADGTVRSIVNPTTGLISENELDSVSEDIGDEFDALMEIYRTTNETSH